MNYFYALPVVGSVPTPCSIILRAIKKNTFDPQSKSDHVTNKSDHVPSEREKSNVLNCDF